MNTHVVTKSLPQGKKVLEPGTEVDASDWRHVRSLEEQRYIKPLGAVETVRPIQPNERDKRMGRKDIKDGNTGN